MEEVAIKKRKGSFRKFIIDGFLASTAFVAAFFAGNGNLHVEPLYVKFVPLYMGCWLVSSVLSGKFKTRWRKRKRNSSFNRMARIRPYFLSALFFAGLLSLFLYGDQWDKLSRIIVFGSLALYLLLETLLLSGIFIGNFKRKEDAPKREFSSLFFLTEFLVISIGTVSLQLFKKGSFRLTDRNTVILSLIFFLWMFIGVVVHKFQIPRDRNYLRAVWPFVKSMFLTACVVSFSIFFLRMTDFSRLIFGYLGIFAVFELLTVTTYFLYTKPRELDLSEFTFVQPSLPEKKIVQEVIEKERKESREFLIPDKDYQSRFIRDKLKHRYLRHYPKIFEFIDHVIDLRTIDIIDAEVLDSGNPYNIEILEDNSLEFLLNLHQLNTYGRIDQYLIDVNNKLKENGFFVSKFEPSEYRLLRFQEKYPWFLSNIVYFFDFIWRRVFPKFPILRRIYFTLTRGRNRVISMAEGFGRLYFCGFEIISLEEVDNYLYFIVKKAKDPYTWFKYFHTFNRVPSFGIFFKQKRVGKDGKHIYMYKVQTMYPYSEFIHKYILELNNLDDSGKIKNDFRITAWGKLFRKLWIDELPMLINLIKGDIKLVGVRPLSQTFFDTYPEDLQKERTKYKPGLIPPYYVDLPKNMDEVLDSERKYLAKYKDHPLRTDIIYLFKAFKNIVFKGAKSG
jgi:lipopolysaccharide/colanic/teichoic acid biosynthesis glycosyltransferase/multisubunit Na+/H+ antiporter MnhC subunit